LEQTHQSIEELEEDWPQRNITSSKTLEFETQGRVQLQRRDTNMEAEPGDISSQRSADGMYRTNLFH
jgi:hypothetical protein